jgi:hypothetical protein
VPAAPGGRSRHSVEKHFHERSAETADPSTARRDRSASLGVCDFFIFRCNLLSESSQEHLPTSIAVVLRLRAIKPSACDRSAKRFAQDYGFVGGLGNTAGWICRKHEKIEKATGSRDDKGKGSGSVESGCWTDALFITSGGLRGPWQLRYSCLHYLILCDSVL